VPTEDATHEAFQRYSKLFRDGPLVGTPEQIVERVIPEFS